MVSVFQCIAYENSLPLVIIAAIVCLFGSTVFLRLVQRGNMTSGAQKTGWRFLAAVAGGGGVWATHFVAMLAFDPGAPVTFDPALTGLSLVVAMLGLFVSLLVSGGRATRILPVVAGALCGLSFSAMHYTGMFAYRVTGLVDWQFAYVVASIALSAALSATSFHLLWHEAGARRFWSAVSLMVVAIVGLHFTGMTAFRVTPMAGTFPVTDAAAITALALAIAVVALIIIGTGLASYLIDTQVREDTRAEFQHMAAHDPLTGLPNRVASRDYMSRMLARVRKDRSRFAVIAIDLNRFKEINDTLGHAAGDEVLQTLAQRLQQVLRDGEFVARIGGDEFVSIRRYSDRLEIQKFAERLSALITMPMKVGGQKVCVGASMGAAVWPDDARDTAELLDRADLAMYHAKHSGMEDLCLYDAEIAQDVEERRQMAEALRLALEEDALELHYQVQKRLTGGDPISGFEALLRWTHPRLGVIAPCVFIPVALRDGLLGHLSAWVLQRACDDALTFDPPTRVSVNVSAEQILDPSLPRLLHETLLASGLPADRLELEITEEALIVDRTRALQVMGQMRALGVGIALDHFGSGHFSLETLQVFPFSRIKLDKSFVDRIGHDRTSKAIFKAVLTLGQALDIPVLAEGIETPDQLDLVRKEGCAEGQGFHLGHPCPVSDARRALRETLEPPPGSGRKPISTRRTPLVVDLRERRG
ncbi:putative bifunctional diguanylate cyclase/phosphodiesterase [Roseibium aestuarii]|uniref:Bifunctional diguanylate cyclase/phosphodiesterase n=1 Tax=Roseibium aestuarii TaxID=2600299 RepID=A0ABW4JSF9_9HYPH|nr:bifunctional diguanylate cyclase/phosphodiesterase [Roseibium aestuarii]